MLSLRPSSRHTPNLGQLLSAFKRTPGHAAARLQGAVAASVRPPYPLVDGVHGDWARFVFEALPEDFQAGAHAEVFGWVALPCACCGPCAQPSPVLNLAPCSAPHPTPPTHHTPHSTPHTLHTRFSPAPVLARPIGALKYWATERRRWVCCSGGSCSASKLCPTDLSPLRMCVTLPGRALLATA
jgi:hypothetical protein